MEASEKQDQIQHGRLFRDTSALMIGAIASQAIMLIALPLLTRLYNPADFGVWGLFQSVAGILAIVGSLRFELAIPMAGTDEEAATGIFLCFITALLVSAALVPLIAFGRAYFLPGRDAAQMARYAWVLIPHAFFIGISSIPIYWWMRHHDFKWTALYRVGNSLLSVALQLAAPFLIGGGTLGLVLGTVIAQWVVTLAACIAIFTKEPEAFRGLRSVGQLLAFAKAYRRLPFFTLPNSLIESGYIQVIMLLMGFWFSATVVGNFYLALKVSYVPFTFVANALAQAFFPQLVRAAPNLRPLSSSISWILTGLVLLGMPVVALIIAKGTPLFTGLFGVSWIDVGPFAGYLVLAYAAVALFSWLDRIYDVLGRQHVNLVFSVTSYGLTLLAFVAAYLLTHDALICVATFGLMLLATQVLWASTLVKVAAFKPILLIRPAGAAVLSGLGLVVVLDFVTRGASFASLLLFSLLVIALYFAGVGLFLYRARELATLAPNER